MEGIMANFKIPNQHSLRATKDHITNHNLSAISTVWFQIEIQSEHKITLHFLDDTENKYYVFRASRPHQSIEKLSKALLDATNVENGYPITEKFVCSALSEERLCNSSRTCIS
jgi:hypothetical protein